MGSMSLIHWIILGALALLLFGGKNKISDVMGDVAKGIKSFKKGLSEDDEPKAVEPRPDPRAAEPAARAASGRAVRRQDAPSRRRVPRAVHGRHARR